MAPAFWATGLQAIIMQGVALCILYIGIDGCLEGSNALIAILSMVIGALLGELLDLDKRMRSLGDWVQRRTAHLLGSQEPASISEGFVTASLLFCVGAMAIVGALNDGLTGDHSTLFAKSLLDGISSVVYAASLGVGVAFSAAAVFIYQGLIAVLASFLQPFLGDTVIARDDLCGFAFDRGAGAEYAGRHQDQGHEPGACHFPPHPAVQVHVKKETASAVSFLLSLLAHSSVNVSFPIRSAVT